MQILTEAQARALKECHVCGQPKSRAALVCCTCEKSSKQFTPLRNWIGGFFADWQMHVKLIREFQPERDVNQTGRTNVERVKAADEMLLRYVLVRRDSPVHREELLTDALADLMHYSQSTGLRFDKALETAIRHYEHEK